MNRVFILILLVGNCFGVMGQAIPPSQFQPALKKRMIHVSEIGAIGENGDSVFVFIEDSLSYFDLKDKPNFFETDPTVPSHVKGITNADINNWNNDLIYDPDTLSLNGNNLSISGGNTVQLNSGMDSIYNGNRNISRVPAIGQNLQATTFRQWLDWWYVGNYTQPTLNMNALSTNLVEVGTSTVIAVSGSTSNPCFYTLSNGNVNFSSYLFGGSTSYTTNHTHAPTVSGQTTLTASQNWTMTTSSCQSGSPSSGVKTASRTIDNVYPIFYGMSATSYTGGSVPYSIFSKRISLESNQTALTMNGTNQFIYIAIPKSWVDWNVLSIIDHNGFNVTPSFTAYDITITSTGLINNWTQNYRLYKLNNLTTANNFNYTYNR